MKSRGPANMRGYLCYCQNYLTAQCRKKRASLQIFLISNCHSARREWPEGLGGGQDAIDVICKLVACLGERAIDDRFYEHFKELGIDSKEALKMRSTGMFQVELSSRLRLNQARNMDFPYLWTATFPQGMLT